MNKINQKEKIDLVYLGEKWLEIKIQRMKNLLKIAEPDEALYREIMISLGYPNNKIQFLELSLMLPFKELKKFREKDIIEKVLLYRAGFVDKIEGFSSNFDYSFRMEKSLWNFKGIRPQNYPDKRIKDISYLLHETTIVGMANYFTIGIKKQTKNIENPSEAKSLVKDIMKFKGIGLERKREMFFNIILPFIIAMNEKEKNELVIFLKELFDKHPPLSENSIIKSFKKSLAVEIDYSKLNTSTKTYFGIHFYVKEIQNNTLTFSGDGA